MLVTVVEQNATAQIQCHTLYLKPVFLVISVKHSYSNKRVVDEVILTCDKIVLKR